MVRICLAAILFAAATPTFAAAADPQSFSAVSGGGLTPAVGSEDEASLAPGTVYDNPARVRYIIINRGEIAVPGAVTTPAESPFSAAAFVNYRKRDYSLVASSVDDTGYSLAGKLLGAGGAVDVPPVPEPGEWAMMLVGLSVVGFVGVRRHRI